MIDSATSRPHFEHIAVTSMSTSTRFLRTLVFVGIVLATAMPAQLTRAQSVTQWTPPVNLSGSGSASQPLIAVSPTGQAHTLWWDALDGTRYARGVVSGTVLAWTPSQVVRGIDGGAPRVPDPAARIPVVAPISPFFAFGASRVGHLAWLREDTLSYAAVDNTVSPPAAIQSSVIAFGGGVDVSGTLHLAYTYAPTRTGATPAGIYYARRGRDVVNAVPVYLSPYFRTARASDVQLSVTGDGAGNLVISWFQTGVEQSLYVRSTDDGRSWSLPAPIAERNAELGVATRVSLAYTPGTSPGTRGSFVMLWRDAIAPGCGLTQRRSTDGGETWGAPERVLNDLSVCPAEWRLFTAADGRLWFFGLPQRGAGNDTGMQIALWDGESAQSWTPPAGIEFTVTDADTGRARSFACLEASLNGGNLSVIGCDPRSDVWSANSTLAMNQVLTAARSPWQPVQRLPFEGVTTRHLTMVSGPAQTFALWSSGAPGAAENTLALSRFDDNRWTVPQPVLAAGARANNAEVAIRMERPAAAYDATGRLHVVWSGGEAGRVFYSRALPRDAQTREGWSESRPLPGSGLVGGAPGIWAHPGGGRVKVIYPVPFNEGRGIYLVTSEDSGETWAAPARVFDASAVGWVGVDSPQIALDPKAIVAHAIWLRLNSTDPTGSRELHYARSNDGGTTWSAPVALAVGALSEPQLITLDNGGVLVAWSARREGADAPAQAPYEVWTRLSPDNGQGWASAGRVPGFELVSGAPSLAAAGGGQAYLGAVGESARREGELRVAAWNGRGWNEPERIPLRQPSALANSAALTVQPSGVLHALIRVSALQTDGQTLPETMVTARAVEPVTLAPLPVLPSPATATPAPVATLEPTPVPTQPISIAEPATSVGGGSNSLILSAALAVVTVLLVALIGYQIMRRRR
jgi:BNR repeat-like domain